MEANLDYTHFVYENIAISFVGDKDSVTDMRNYLYYHIPDNSITMSAISLRLQLNDLYVHVRRINNKAKLLPFMFIRRIFRKQTSKLLNDREFIPAMIYLKEDAISVTYGVPHLLIVRCLIASMWKRFITKLDESDLDLENPDPSSTLLFHELAEKEQRTGGV